MHSSIAFALRWNIYMNTSVPRHPSFIVLHLSYMHSSYGIRHIVFVIYAVVICLLYEDMKNIYLRHYATLLKSLWHFSSLHFLSWHSSYCIRHIYANTSINFDYLINASSKLFKQITNMTNRNISHHILIQIVTMGLLCWIKNHEDKTKK